MGKTLRIRILIIALIFAAITAVAVAVAVSSREKLTMSAFYYGTGTEDDPYRIYSSSQLLNLQEVTDSGRAAELTKGKYFKLFSDMDVRHLTSDYGRGFYGILDGDGHTVNTKDRGLFFQLQSGAAIKNLNINFAFDGAYYDEAFALCSYIDEGATVENCHAYGDINIKISKSSNFTEMNYSVFANKNYGTIKDCSYTGNITKTGNGRCGNFYLGIMGLTDSGEVDSCTVNCNIDLALVGYGRNSVSGIAPRCTNCTYNGNIVLRDNSAVTKNSRLNLYGLGIYAEGCTFNGDLSHNLTRFTRFALALSSEEHDNAHNGEIKLFK